MKILLSDIMADCCPVNACIGIQDDEVTERVKALVAEKIGKKKTHRHIPARTLLIAAIITMLLTATAFAVSEYFMNTYMMEAEETVTGRWLIQDADGEVLEEQRLVFPDAGQVFTFTGPEEKHNRPEFRCFWLPTEPDPTFSFTDEEGWTQYLIDTGEGSSLPYVINIANVNTRCTYILNGSPEIIREFDRGGWHVTEITSDYTDCSVKWGYERANFIILFDASRGYLLLIRGTADMETLEHIVNEMEVRESGEPAFDDPYSETIGIIDPGRG